MDRKSLAEWNRRAFLRNAAVGTVGATWVGALPAAEDQPELSEAAFAAQQAEREALEHYARSFAVTMDDLNIEGFLSFFSEDVHEQDVILGDFSELFPAAQFENCRMHPKTTFRTYLTATMTMIGTPGRFIKYIHSVGNTTHGFTMDMHVRPGAVFNGGIDLISYADIRNGKIFRRNDYWDTAQLTPQDIALIHPGGVPRQSCLAGALPGDTSNATSDMLSVARALNSALSSGSVDRVLRFFSDDALLIHPLLYRGTGEYGPYNRGLQIRGSKVIARFLRAVLPLLPDGLGSTLVHVVGGSHGGGYEWKSGDRYATQGIARNGIFGATSIELFGGRIHRMSVKFDTLQMTPAQRAAVRNALSRVGL